MSNSLAIAAVTATLRSILDEGTGAKTTILPLDKAGGSNTGPHLNLFLYQVVRNGALANMDMPRQVQAGESGIPPLPLDLYYLITAFADDNDLTGAADHALLGKAMSVLHDHPVLSADDIKDSTSQHQDLKASDLDRQLERIRITLHPTPLDELSKLWTGFATHYRLSVAYQVAVALIESARATRTPLPVLARGQDDAGIASQAALSSPFPTLETLKPPNKQPSARLNDIVELNGFHLDGETVEVRFRHPLWALLDPVPPLVLSDPPPPFIDVPPELTSTDKKLGVRIPNAPKTWPAGFYNVAVQVRRSGETFRRSTNELVMALAPTMTIAAPQVNADTIEFEVTVAPQVWPAQRAALLLGDREIIAEPHDTETDQLTFVAKGVPSGSYYVRLRVDGVDSLLVDRSVTPPVFDASQKVTIP